MANLKLFLAPAIILCALGVSSAQVVSCIEQFYKNLVWYDNELDIISKKVLVRNNEKLVEKCSALTLLIARVIQSGCQLSALQLSELGRRQNNLLAAGVTSCWAAKPYRTSIVPAFSVQTPLNQAVASRNIYENLNSCQVRVSRCYLRFQVNLMMRSGYRNQTCSIIESFAACLLDLKDCGFSEFLRPRIMKEAISQTEFRFWESKECPVNVKTPTTLSFIRETTATPPIVTSKISITTTTRPVTHAPTDCGRAKFRCRNGNCVNLTQICNSVDDCGDASDETECQSVDKQIGLEIEQNFVKYGCYNVMPTCTSLYITPLLLSLQGTKQLDPEKLCKASNRVFMCAVYESCPLSAEDRVKVSALLVQAFEKMVSRKTCQLVINNSGKNNSTGGTTYAPSSTNTASITTSKKEASTTNIATITSTPNIATITSTPNIATIKSTPNIPTITSTPNIATITSTPNIATITSTPKTINTLKPTSSTRTSNTNSTSKTNVCVRSCDGINSGNYQSCSGCHVYATCVEGVLYDSRPCPANLVWDDGSKTCESSSTTCQNPPVTCVSSCSGLPSGDYQSCKGCDVYVTCDSGILIDNRPCPATLVWNDINKRCDQYSTTCKPAEGKPKGYNCIKSCEGLSSGQYQSCLGCSVYATCKNGVFTDNLPCSNFMVWDDAVKKCESVSSTCNST